ncbi:MAG: DUF2076 domain-containing protein, partial [Phyllobacteriaceae bacterium]|nr:DUF2076 domain-containing protein [Phyllobacteriaceae bacterium]
MTPQEAQIIRSVFDRLKAMEAGPRDAEAEALVEALQKADPQAGLGLVRALVMTDQARAAAVADAEAARRELEAMRAAPAPQPASGGLFGGLFGGAPQAPAPQPMPQAGPWGARPQAGPWDAQPQPQQGSGFWGSALRTGAGVAGGLFAFEAVKSLFGGGAHAGWGGSPTAGFFDQPTTVVNETVNVFQGDRSGQLPSGVFDAPGAIDDRGGGWSD